LSHRRGARGGGDATVVGYFNCGGDPFSIRRNRRQTLVADFNYRLAGFVLPGSLDGFWSLRPVERPSVFNRYFDGAGQCNALLSWHGNHLPVSFSAIASSYLIAAFAGLTRIWIKIGAAIHTVRLRGGLSSGIRLNGVRQDRHQTHRKAGS